MEDKLSIHFPINSFFSDIIICGAGFHRYKKEDYFAPLSNSKLHTYCSLHFVVSGAGTYTLNNKKYVVKKGQILATFPNHDTYFQPDKTYPWTYYWINFLGSRASALLEHLKLTPDSPILDVSANAKKIEKLFVSNMHVCLDNPDDTEIITLYHLLQIYSELTKTPAHAAAQIPKQTEYAKKAVEYIRKNYADSNLTLQKLAKELNINDSYLSRLFRQEISLNFVDYLAMTRIQAAITLIDDGVYTVCQLADSVGFNDPYYFSKVFKRLQGIPPKAQIQKVKNKKGKKSGGGGRNSKASFAFQTVISLIIYTKHTPTIKQASTQNASVKGAFCVMGELYYQAQNCKNDVIFLAFSYSL